MDVTVATPASIAAVADVLRDAQANRNRVMPVGGGTHLAWGKPIQHDVRLQTSALDRVESHVPEDMTISVQAGMSVEALRSVLSGSRSRLPLDVEEPPLATIGGTVAVGYTGPRRLGLGTLRERLIGGRVVLADGSVVKTGGMVVKNVSGYDLTRLLHGSMGSLGVIVVLNFKLSPLPDESTASAYEMPSRAQALSAAMELAASRLPYTALHASFDGTLAVGCEGHAADVRRLRSEADMVAARFGGRECEFAEGESSAGRFWGSMLRSPVDSAEASFRIVSSPSRIAWACENAERIARARGYAPRWWADAGCGIVELSVDVGASADADGLAALEHDLIDEFRTVRVTRCPEALRGPLAVFGSPPRGAALMRALKEQFDPHGVLNAGANVGGI